VARDALGRRSRYVRALGVGCLCLRHDFASNGDGGAPFDKVSSIQNRCLTWSSAGLYACGTDLGRGLPATMPPSPEPAETFAVGLSRDMGTTFDTLYKLTQTCPTVCPDDSRFNRVCRMTWEMKPGVTTATGATGATCTVDWAKTAVTDGGSEAGKEEGGARGGKDAGDESGQGEPMPSDSCGCRIVGTAAGGPARAATGAFALALGALLARRRRHGRPSSRKSSG